MKKIKQDPKSFAKEMGVKLPKKKKDTILDIELREEEEWDDDDDY